MSEPAGARYVPHLLLTAMIAIWGGSYAVVKVALESLPPFAVVALRFWLAVACVLPFVRPGFGAELRAAARPGLLAGALLALGYLLQTLGMNETSASMGGFLSGLIVLLAGVGGFVFFRARFGALSVLGFVLGLAGMALLCWPGEVPAGTPVVDTPRGILLQIGSSTAYAAHILLLSRFGRTVPPLAFCSWQLLVTAVVATAVGTSTGELTAARLAATAWTPGLIAALVYLGALANTLGIAVQGRVQHRIPPVHVALLFTTQPLFAALVAWLALGDRMGPMQLAGGLTIVLGVLASSLDRR
ncbi:MAG: DMT family transporter [Planctomycetes bacterium]|nr:DMT family transporter [Planctomycetota bacterium]